MLLILPRLNRKVNVLSVKTNLINLQKGYDNMNKENNAAKENKQYLAVSLSTLMEQSGKSRSDICKDLNIKYSTLADWINAKSYPRIDKIDALAKYFDVPKSILTGWKSQEEQNQDLEKNIQILSNEYLNCKDEFVREKIKITIDSLNQVMNTMRKLSVSIKFESDYRLLNNLYWLQRFTKAVSDSMEEINIYMLKKSTQERLEKSKKKQQ